MKLNRIITLYQMYTTKVKVTDNIMHFPREGLLVDDSPSKTTKTNNDNNSNSIVMTLRVLQVTVDRIYNVLQFVDGGWLVDVRTVSTFNCLFFSLFLTANLLMYYSAICSLHYTSLLRMQSAIVSQPLCCQ